MITCEQCGHVNGSRSGKTGSSWICEDCKIGDVKVTLTNKDGKVTIVREKRISLEIEEE
jgi:hypothetical protein